MMLLLFLGRVKQNGEVSDVTPVHRHEIGDCVCVWAGWRPTIATAFETCLVYLDHGFGAKPYTDDLIFEHLDICDYLQSKGCNRRTADDEKLRLILAYTLVARRTCSIGDRSLWI